MLPLRTNIALNKQEKEKKKKQERVLNTETQHEPAQNDPT